MSTQRRSNRIIELAVIGLSLLALLLALVWFTRLEGVEPYPSEGNFILMSVAASRRTNDEIIRIAHSEKILLRAMGSHRLRGTHVRVTIGLAEQNDRFLDLFGRLFAPGASLASRSA